MRMNSININQSMRSSLHKRFKFSLKSRAENLSAEIEIGKFLIDNFAVRK